MAEESREVVNVEASLDEAKKTLYDELLPTALTVLEEVMLAGDTKAKLEAAKNVLDIIPETSTKKNAGTAIVGNTINFSLGTKKLRKIVDELEVIGGEYEDISVEKLESFEEGTASDGEGGA